jgi:two-component system, chemotaxis family, response regulator WspR
MSEDPDLDLELVPAPADKYLSMVLLVDDQVMICEAVRRALAGQPELDFHYCTNPLDAIRIANETKPTVILQDLVMPGMDGLDLVREYRQNPATQAVPVIVLSAKEEPAIKGEAFNAGANDYLVKLPDRIELIARIRYHTRAYLDHVQRNQAYRALRESQRQLIKANLELERLTRIDGLTSLGNRRYFDEYLSLEWMRGRRRQTPISVLMIDVDNFKRYNDSYGHLAGDEALKRVARVIQDSLSRATDLAARFGGEEFVAVLVNGSETGANQIAEKMVQAVRDLRIPHGEGCVTISIGVANALPGEENSAGELLHNADQALFRAKMKGRDRVVSYESLDEKKE